MTPSQGRRSPVLARLAACVVALAACGPASQPVAPAYPASAPPGWSALVDAARREGRLVLAGPPSDVWRSALLSFEKAYPGISVEYTGITSRDFWPRVTQEKRVGQHLWDLRVGGPDPQVFQARDDGFLTRVKPLLVLPEATDDEQWFGASRGLLYADAAGTQIRNFLMQGSTQIHVNRDSVPASAFRSARDLIDPRWKGKIVQQDPRGGSGLGALTVLLSAYGEDFVRTLLSKQDVIITSDNRQEAEWLVRGKYPIGVGSVADEILYFEQQGVRSNVVLLDDAPRALSVGFGAIQILTSGPHPNATQLYVNWLLTRAAQSTIATTIQVNSLRLDVPPGNPDLAIDPQRLQDYVPHQFEKMLPVRKQAQQLAAELLR